MIFLVNPRLGEDDRTHVKHVSFDELGLAPVSFVVQTFYYLKIAFFKKFLACSHFYDCCVLSFFKDKTGYDKLKVLLKSVKCFQKVFKWVYVLEAQGENERVLLASILRLVEELPHYESMLA